MVAPPKLKRKLLWRSGGLMQKKHITIPLSGGLATGQDGKLLPIGKSERLENVRPGRLGEVVQRAGTRILGQTLIGAGGSLPSSWALGTLRGDLVSFAGVGDHPVQLYSPTADAWTTNSIGLGVGGFASTKTKRRGPIVATSQQISGSGRFPDHAYANGYYFEIYRTTRNGVDTMIMTVIEAATGEPVLELPRSAGPYVSWGVRIVNGSAVFVYATAALISIETWSTSAIGTNPLTTISVAKAVANAGREFDMYVKDATTISAAYSDGANVQCFDYVPLAGAATFWTPKDAAAANIPTSYGLAWMQDTGASGKIALIVLPTVGGLKAHWDIPTAGATRQAVTSYVLDGAAFPGAVAGFTMTNSATGQFTVLYEGGNLASSTTTLNAATREAGVIGLATYYRGLSLGSKPFLASDGKYYVGAEYNSTTQPTRFVVRVPETRTAFANLTSVVAKTQVNNGYVGAAIAGPLCPAVSPAANEYVYANTVQLRLPGNPTAYVPQGVGVYLVHVKFLVVGDTTTGPPREAIDSLFTPGGMVGQFDGRSYVEAGFPYYPEPASIVAGGAGFLHAAGAYYYVDVYSWIDLNGRVWRSAPSRVVTVATALNAGNIITSSTMRLADRDDITIEHYRGALNDNVTFQLIGTSVNDPTVDTVNFTDTFTDAIVANGQALYTNGATGNRPLAADGIPGGSSLLIAGDRAWFVSNDNPYEVWPSNKFIPGQGWRFSEQNKLILNDNLGPVFGLGVTPSGVVVAIKDHSYQLISGDGPNQAGNGGSFTVSPPAVGVGTTNPRSILETPSGIEFRSNGTTRAWYRVNTALQAEYIGSPIERYTNLPGTSTPMSIVGAALVTATGETRYYTSETDGGQTKCLIHDAISDTWMVDTSADDFGHNLAACPYGAGAAVAAGSRIFVDDPTVGSDGGSPFTVVAATPWIKGGDLDGYATFIKVRGVGESPSAPPGITIALQADFDTSTNVTLQTASPGTLWDWELKYPAKLSSFRFVISYLATAVPVRMTALVVEYGVKSGMAPLSYTKRSQ